jgi:GT2 family glycosyltransferase
MKGLIPPSLPGFFNRNNFSFVQGLTTRIFGKNRLQGMSGKPLFSILLTTHTKPEQLEALLDALLGFELSHSEIILVNDNAERSHVRALELLLDMYPNNNVQYITHQKTWGRAKSLNQALSLSSGSLIWAPLKADRLNKDLLRSAVKRMSENQVAFWVLDRDLPNNLHDWVREAEDGTLPNDNQFVFNRSYVSNKQFYFRQDLPKKVAVELAYRVMRKKPYQRTDAFFIIDKTPAPPPNPLEIQEFIFTMIRETDLEEERRLLIDRLKKLDPSGKPIEAETSKLEEASIIMDQDPRLALDLVNSYLKKLPNHFEALKLKITVLEKLRRHVEASELKHTLQKRIEAYNRQNDTSSEKEQPTLFDAGKSRNENSEPKAPEDVQLSIIIPTTGDGKPLLEQCLVHLGELCRQTETELIVIDNASIDDTFEYLEQLQQVKFLNIRILTNKQNVGFAASANQGMESANGKYLLIMHNDVFLEEGAIEEMMNLLRSNQYLGVVGPVVDQCDVHEQTVGAIKTKSQRFFKIEKIDSCCMMMRSNTNIRFDDSYGLAFLEDADLCNSLAEIGLYAAVAIHARGEHYHRATTDAMGLNLEPEYIWRNREIFNEKWNIQPGIQVPVQGDVLDIIKSIPDPVNPVNPPNDWLNKVSALFTDEVRTELLNRKLSRDDYFELIRILMIADKRDLLRQIETKVEQEVLPEELLQSLIRYYFRRNIYSRCRIYLDKTDAEGPFYDLFRLRIAVAEKETDHTVELLTGLMKQFPCHPELYKLAGDIHRIAGNEGESKSFYALAGQLNPFLKTELSETIELEH